MIEPNDEEKQEELPNDFDTPFSPPSGILDTIDDTHQEADTNVDEQERYDEGISGAAEVSDPGNLGVVEYSPPQSAKDKASKSSNPRLHKTYKVPDLG